TSLAIAWAVGEWILACWLLAPFRALPPALQLLALPVMALLNRLAACVFEREPRLPALVDRPARVVTAAGFAAFAGAGVFLVLAGLWIVGGVLGGLPADAGVVAGTRETFSLPHGFQLVALPLATACSRFSATTIASRARRGSPTPSAAARRGGCCATRPWWSRSAGRGFTWRGWRIGRARRRRTRSRTYWRHYRARSPRSCS